MNKTRNSILIMRSIGCGIAILAGCAVSSYAQYGYNQGYGGYGGYSQGYGGYNQGYGNYGGYNQGYNNYGGSGFGSRMGSFGSGRMGRSSGRMSQYGNYGGYNQGYSGRSSRRGNSYSNYGGQISPGAQGGNIGGQTTPSGTSSAQRRSLSGKTAQGGALPGLGGGSAGGGDSGGISVQGKTAQTAAPGVPSNIPGRPQTAKKTPQEQKKPVTQLALVSRSTIAVVSQPVDVYVKLLNAAKLGFNDLAFVLKYNPNELMPVAGQDEAGEWIPAHETVTAPEPDENAADAAATSPSENEGAAAGSNFLFAGNRPNYKKLANAVDPKRGIIHFAGKIEGETCTDSGFISRITFLPLKEKPHSNITFLFSDPETGEADTPLTHLMWKNEDRLGSKLVTDDGVVNLSLEIYSSLEKAPRRTIVKRADDKKSEEEGHVYSTHLTLSPRQTQVDVGDLVDVDVVLSNPDQDVFDTIGLLIAYNPRILEPLDGNDVDQGINVDDQEGKSKFIFDFPILNTVDPDKGIIDYRKKGLKAPLREEGVLATLRFRAIRPTKKTTFRVFLNEAGEDPTTKLTFRNRDRLGDPSDPFDGVTTASLEIRPTMAYLKKIGKSG